MSIIRAAGGLLWREGEEGRRRLALVHRPHRSDWSLPKGKLKDGERWEDAAIREVGEETGCLARVVSFAGVVHYVPKRTAKVVLFWNMELVDEGPLRFPEEVDQVAWLTAPEALRRLDYETERELLVEALELRHFESAEEMDAAPRRSRGATLVFAALGALGGAVLAGVLAAWLGPPGGTPLALGAAALGGLAAAAASALSRPRR